MNKLNRVLGGLLVLAAGSASAQDADEARKATPRDIAQWAEKIQQDYPAAALRNDEQGTVTMRLQIGIDGRVQTCEVIGSSESVALDEAACFGMQEHARFDPARNQQGEPIGDSITQSIRYVMPERRPSHYKPAIPIDEHQWRAKVFDEAFVTALNESTTGRVLFVVTVDEGGNAAGCGMMWPSGDAELDRRGCADIRRHGRFLAAELQDGTTIPGVTFVGYPSIDAIPTVRSR